MENIFVVIHMRSYTLTGYLALPEGRRLSDYLNGYSENTQAAAVDFLKVTKAIIFYANGKKEVSESIYVNREAVEMLSTVGENDARGVGAAEETKGFPYVIKMPLKSKLNTLYYEIEGYLHLREKQDLNQLLTQKRTFIPCTKVKIHDISKDTWEEADFVAINRTKVDAIR